MDLAARLHALQPPRTPTASSPARHPAPIRMPDQPRGVQVVVPDGAGGVAVPLSPSPSPAVARTPYGFTTPRRGGSDQAGGQDGFWGSIMNFVWTLAVDEEEEDVPIVSPQRLSSRFRTPARV